MPDFSKTPKSLNGRLMAKSIFNKNGKEIDSLFYFEIHHRLIIIVQKIKYPVLTT